MAKSIFYDPDRKRWGRLRILLSVLGAIISALVLFFIITVFVESDPLPHVLMPAKAKFARIERARAPEAAQHKKHAPQDQVFTFTSRAEYR